MSIKRRSVHEEVNGLLQDIATFQDGLNSGVKRFQGIISRRRRAISAQERIRDGKLKTK